MDGKKVITLFGIDIRLHYTWWIVFALLGWSLSTGYFPQFYPGLSSQSYWVMGIVASLLLFISVVLHEISHSLVALARKLKVQHITLFFFGGVSSIPTEDIKPTTEFLMAAAGPLFSLFFAGFLFGITLLPLPTPIAAILVYLVQLNLILGIFNLLPGYPLDGGRMFRALLMFYFKDIKKATHIASIGGRIVGGGLAILGILTITGGGLWLILLGTFLYFIAGLSYEQLLLKEALDRIPTKLLFTKKYAKTTPRTKLAALLKTAHAQEHEGFIVMQAGKFLGIVDLENLAKRRQKPQKNSLVQDVMIPTSTLQAGSSSDSSFDIFRKMTEQNLNILPVVKNKKVSAVVHRKTLMHRVKMRMQYGLE